MAKAAGNGYPIGFVVTRREIADRFAAQGSFFSSVGGSPVSSAIGIAVLDTIHDEDLQGYAARVGAHPVNPVGHVGRQAPDDWVCARPGLYQGIDLVRDPETREPATAEAAASCERLRELGVIE